MKKYYLSLIAATAISAAAADSPLWLRETAISPDGRSIAFTYKGDIFVVSAEGGTARQLTTSAAYDAQPVWSPDGSHIVFVSTREGGKDIYITDARGGKPRRLTTHSAAETPLTFALSLIHISEPTRP